MNFFKKLFKKMPLPSYLIYSAVILLGIALDQLTKLLASLYLKPIDDVPLWDGVFHLNYHENTGAAFGMMADARWIFMLFSTVAILLFGVYLFSGRVESRLTGVAMAMIVSGGIGNMIDRIAAGYVVDFLYFKLINFAIFNVADAIVCIGAGLLVLAVTLELIAEAKKKKSEGDGEDGTNA